MAVVLLVLRGIGSGIVAEDGDQAAVQLQQRELDEGVGRDVETDAFDSTFAGP